MNHVFPCSLISQEASGLLNDAGYMAIHDEELNKASSQIQPITSKVFVEKAT
jgi:hypothetical protein